MQTEPTYDVTFLTGAVVLPVISTRYNAATGYLESYEARPGRTLTEEELRDYRGSYQEARDAAEARAVMEADLLWMLSDFWPPRREPWWKRCVGALINGVVILRVPTRYRWRGA